MDLGHLWHQLEFFIPKRKIVPEIEGKDGGKEDDKVAEKLDSDA